MLKNIPERRIAAILTKSVHSVTIISFFIYSPYHPNNVRCSSMKISWYQLVSIKKTPQLYSAFPDRNPLSQTFKAQIKGNILSPNQLVQKRIASHATFQVCTATEGTLRVTSLLSLLAALLQDKVGFSRQWQNLFDSQELYQNSIEKKSLRSDLQKC